MKYRVKRHPVVQPLDESIRLIPLTQGQNAIVDAADYEWLMQWNWIAHWDSTINGFYAHRSEWNGGDRRTVSMHRVVLRLLPDDQGLADHKSGDTLDNRRSNLRVCDSSRNSQNRRVRSDNGSGHTGVYFRKDNGKWQAAIYANNRRIHLGHFMTMDEAVAARREAAVRYFGEFARLDH